MRRYVISDTAQHQWTPDQYAEPQLIYVIALWRGASQK
jgi:hypothetical protein